jgi:hypothetical protein
MKTRRCNHNWIEDFDYKTDQLCYNAGLNYRPAYYICTKCGMTKRIKDDDRTEWYEVLLMIPMMLIMLILVAVFDILIFPLLIISDLIQHNRSANK